MATTRKEIGYGSSGSEVKELQSKLNGYGNYNLATDGKFGEKTLAAVKDYQQKNKLAVDGIVGKNTWGSLLGGAKNATTTAPTTNSNKMPNVPQSTTNNKPTTQKFQESDLISQAKAAIEQHKGTMPGGNKNTFLDSINDTLNKIMNREEFSFDINGDALYNQYKDLYSQQGKMAMMDTMGQAAALTGGYGNSYASTAGNQAYQASLQQLNEVVPELYQLAYQKYRDEGDALAQQYALYSDMDDREKAREREELSNYYKQLDYLSNEENKLYNREFNEFADQRDFNHQVEREAIADQQYKEQFDYTKERNDIEDSKWYQNFDHATGLDKAQMELQKAQLAAQLGDTSKLKALGYDVSNYGNTDSSWLSKPSVSDIQETLYTAESPEQLAQMLETYRELGMPKEMALDYLEVYMELLGFNEEKEELPSYLQKSHDNFLSRWFGQ